MQSAIIIAFFGIGLIQVSRVIFGSMLNPWNTWIFPWTIVLFLFCIKAIAYEDLSNNSVLALCLANAGFVVGSIVGTPLWHGHGNMIALLRLHRSQEPKSRTVELGEVSFRIVVVMSSMATIAVALYAVQEYNFTELLTGAYRFSRGKPDAATLPVVPAAMMNLVLPASLISGLRIATYRKIDRWDVSIGLSVLIYSLIISGRTQVIIWLILVATGYVLSNHRRGVRVRISWTGLLTIILGLLFFFVVAQIRGSLQEFAYKIGENRLASSGDLSPRTLLLNAYVYATSSIANLNYFLQIFDGVHTWGASVAYPATYQLAKLGLVKLRFFQATGMEAANTLGGTNVYTIVRVMYMDFGLAGCFFLSFALGALLNFLYSKFLQTGSIGFALCVGYLCVLSIASPYEYILYGTIDIVPFFLAFILARAATLFRPTHSVMNRVRANIK